MDSIKWHYSIVFAATVVVVVTLIYAASVRSRARQGAIDAGALVQVAAEKTAAAFTDTISERPKPPLGAAELTALAGGDYDGARRAVDRALTRVNPGASAAMPRLSAAAASALAGGKRLRGVIALEVGRRALELRGSASDADAARVGEAAVFAECAHAASLVIDDGAAFDDDAERRGGASVPAAFGAATAQLAALALLMECVESAARAGGGAGAIEAARALGAAGAAAGQALDSVAAPAELMAAGGLRTATRLKTAPFYGAAAVTGWLAAAAPAVATAAANDGSSEEVAVRLRDAGTDIGYAMQICDDIGDVATDAARAASGKPGRNFVAEFGLVAALGEAGAALHRGREALDSLDLWTPRWALIYEKIVSMTGLKN